MAKKEKERGRPEGRGRPENPGQGRGQSERGFTSRPGSAEFHDEKVVKHQAQLDATNAAISELETELAGLSAETDAERIAAVNGALDELRADAAEYEADIAEHTEAAARKRAGEVEEEEPAEEEDPAV